MAQKRKRGRPLGGEKGAILSVRVSPETRWHLVREARRNQRSLSREVEARLDFAFDRYGTGRPDHVTDLAELVALLARSVERQTHRAWDRNPRTRRWLVEAFARLIEVYSTAEVTEATISVPDRAPLPDNPATRAVGEVLLTLQHAPHAARLLGPASHSGVLAKIFRNLERRRRRK
jgi:hypothetical protein